MKAEKHSTGKMNQRKISIIVFYTDSGKILLQERKGITKFGEEWTFFGGKIEEGETALEAAIREIDEELGYILDNPIHIGSCSTITTFIKTNEKVEMSAEVYSKKMDEDLSIFELKEGSGLKFFKIEEAKQLKLGPLDYEIITMFEKSLVV